MINDSTKTDEILGKSHVCNLKYSNVLSLWQILNVLVLWLFFFSILFIVLPNPIGNRLNTVFFINVKFYGFMVVFMKCYTLYCPVKQRMTSMQYCP